jgi:NTP pyrophosphatase (non-canonical NTP hydrolase)
MEIKEAQQIVNDWILTTGKGYFSPLTNMALLTEEVGEVARVIARTYGDQVAKESDLHVKLSEELADALWVIICLANQTGIDLEQALRQSLDKKNRRDAHRF